MQNRLARTGLEALPTPDKALPGEVFFDPNSKKVGISFANDTGNIPISIRARRRSDDSFTVVTDETGRSRLIFIGDDTSHQISYSEKLRELDQKKRENKGTDVVKTEDDGPQKKQEFLNVFPYSRLYDSLLSKISLSGATSHYRISLLDTNRVPIIAQIANSHEFGSLLTDSIVKARIEVIYDKNAENLYRIAVDLHGERKYTEREIEEIQTMVRTVIAAYAVYNISIKPNQVVGLQI